MTADHTLWDHDPWMTISYKGGFEIIVWILLGYLAFAFGVFLFIYIRFWLDWRKLPKPRWPDLP